MPTVLPVSQSAPPWSPCLCPFVFAPCLICLLNFCLLCFAHTRIGTQTQQWHAGDNVGTGTDFTIFSKVDGIVVYSKKPGRDIVSVSCLVLFSRVFLDFLGGRKGGAGGSRCGV